MDIWEFPEARIWKSQSHFSNTVYILHIFKSSTSFWGVFNLLWWSCRQIICNYTFSRTNLTVTVFLLFLCSVSIEYLSSVYKTCFKFSNFKKLILKIWEIFAYHLSDVQTKCEILLPLILLGTRYDSNIFVCFHLFFFWNKLKPASNDHIVLTTIHTCNCKEWYQTTNDLLN